MKLCKISRVVPGCHVMVWDGEEAVEATVIAIHRKAAGDFALCRIGRQVRSVPVSECKLQIAVAAGKKYTTRGKLLKRRE